MATLLLAPPASSAGPSVPGTATLVLVMSPIRGPLGELRTARREVVAGSSVADTLPKAIGWARLIWNGRVLSLEESQTVRVHPGDEILAFPTWGTGVELVPILIAIGVGLVVSVATTALSYLLFPPAKPHMQPHLDDPSFSFEGIRTTIGPGQVVPVSYGRQRLGGQLLSDSVEEAVTVVDAGPGNRVRVEAVTAPATMTMLVDLGSGPVSDVQLSTIEINNQPIANFPSVVASSRLGTADQTPIPEFGETRNTFADGREISGDPGMTYTTTVPVTAFVLNVVFPEGLFTLTSRGEKEENVSVFGFQYREAGVGEFGAYSYYDVAAARTAAVRFGVRREGLPLVKYDIHCQWSHASSINDVQSKWKPFLESVTEIQANTTAYPLDALVGIRALATDAIQGSLPNMTTEFLARTVRVGSFAASETWTDNPAWCDMDFLTNTRYGLHQPDSSIDLAGFAALAAYCDQLIDGEKRHTLNWTLDRDMRAQAALMEMLGGHRTLLLKVNGLWTPRPTRDDPPVQLLTWTNCTNVTLNYTRDPDRINVMEARFQNEENGFLQDVLTWPTIDNWPVTVRKASLEIRGVTKPSRIMRALQFELNRRRFETLAISLDCALDACVIVVHDLFRFSHPLPGWGVSGCIQPGSTVNHIQLDNPVTFDGLHDYHLYVRHEDGTTEVSQVYLNFPGFPYTEVILVSPLTQTPVPYTSRYAYGWLTPEGAVKVFRATKVQRKSDTTVHIEGIIHNPSIYDEPTASPLPVITTLFNPLGAPPPLTSLILTEVTRIQASGASYRVVNLSWDVAALSTGFAPYGGARVLRRTVTASAIAGGAEAGAVDLGAIQSATDFNVNFLPIAALRGHVLDLDDYTVISGTTYVYRVIPVSQRGIPNEAGALERVIHVAGPTTPGYFPGTVRNLRLVGQAVGVTIFEGRDVHLTWDPLADSPLFSQTFFVQDYIVEVWAPGQLVHLRTAIVAAGPPGQALLWTYTLEQNAEDQIHVGQPGARRDLMMLVWARTNTNRQSLEPASITVNNPAPDMSNIIPSALGLFQAAVIDWDEYFEPRDFDHYEVHLDTVTPPVARYQDIAVSFTGQGVSFRKVMPVDLLADVPYYVQILPYDTFGVGIASQIATFTPVSLTADRLDSVPPAVPTGLALTTGVTIGTDGTATPWVQASWTPNVEGDLAGYQLNLYVDGNLTPTVFTVGKTESSVRLQSVPGNVTIDAKLLAFDQFYNQSVYGTVVSITTGADTVAPAAPTNLTAVGSIKAVQLLWTPPADKDFDYAEVWSSATNNRATAIIIGTGTSSFTHDGLGASDTRYYWVRAVDRSGNASAAYYPASATAGISGTAGQLDTTYISSLAANKLLAGIVTVLVSLGVNNIALDGVNSIITITDNQASPIVRIKLGKLGALSTDWGLQIFNSAGQLMWNLSDGAQTAGIKDLGITSGKIAVGALLANHLQANIAYITGAAQIANAIITDAHIIGLTADKINSGTINVLLSMSVGAAGRLHLDGPNKSIIVSDDNGANRVQMGKTGGATTDYGLNIWDEFGNLMWSFTSGAQTRGIATSSVITDRIAVNAVTQSLAFASGVGTSATLGTGEVQVGFIVFSNLEAGDLVHLVITGSATIGASTTMQLLLRAGTSTGAIITGIYESDACLSRSVVFQATDAPAAGQKYYVLTINNGGGPSTVTINEVSIVGTRYRR